MKRIFLILFIILLSINPMSAKTLKGGVEYTESQIKKMAFDGVKKKLPRKMIEANKIDPFYDENMAMKEKGQKETDDRVVRFLNDGWYYVYYGKNIQFIYLYDSIGNLRAYGIFEQEGNKYPYKIILYDTNGNLHQVSYCYKNEMYTYDVNGNLKDYWKE